MRADPSARRRVSLLLIPLCLLATACGPKKGPVTTADVAGAGQAAPPVPVTTLAEADARYGSRHERAATEEAITLYEAALAADPARADAAAIEVRLAVLYHGLGYWFDKDADKATRIQWFWKGKEHAFSALRRNGTFAAALDGGATIPEAVIHLGEADAPAMFWCATDWARWGELKGILRVALDIPKVRGLQERLLAVAERYYEGGAHRFFAAYFVAIPEFAGQDFSRARAHCERSLEIAPDHQENRILCAEYAAVALKDRPWFEALLGTVLASAPDPTSPYHFEAFVAVEDARRLSAKADELFAE